ncbi:putative RNase H-like HicB family nuclease [Rhizobium rosettiformans]|uniref:Type II toxin-antitoxin system HicB family antitoxin n=2 Tax=Rhizobium rosettiformans TaxID=1368430 RepID=A0A4S8Q1A2_9HYPH|nr:type II toxin-antitoxin system HicB family antitoxin [Rhizobium rosettiformans]MBB5274515.1 putative RNase H-like HicB family nuclease [Rhizobium rosettiformans]THV37873.1 type II toxin-antitoxin system HicB family antitoxin [Rhizobium rosettiformans W3]
MRSYIGLIHKEPESDYGVSFPDFPGIATAGTSLDDARQMAEEALAFHVEGMVEDGEAIPEPSSLEQIMADPANMDAVAVLIPLKSQAKKSVRLNITLPEDVLREIDAYAEAHGLTRSGFLAQAAKRQMKDDGNPGNAKGYALSA